VSDRGYWALALILGLVVAIVAVVLLEIFLRQVHRVERGAGLIWTAGKQVAGNTATTWLLGDVSSRLDVLHAEAVKHVQLLSPPSVSDRPTSVPGGAI